MSPTRYLSENWIILTLYLSSEDVTINWLGCATCAGSETVRGNKEKQLPAKYISYYTL